MYGSIYSFGSMGQIPIASTDLSYQNKYKTFVTIAVQNELILNHWIRNKCKTLFEFQVEQDLYSNNKMGKHSKDC